ncbi:zinc finger DHHC domain containing protein [Tubulinosema ratisbonensis]|uniref:Palmitoyltransferase n=1 Tax=Tubulinosema ratisbonensis TaxID=291195 RepID=A0A437AKS6_9MICR|nr:zinc finger DHHC domain containing protein [Tubulinosema ratisbonensis]
MNNFRLLLTTFVLLGFLGCSIAFIFHRYSIIQKLVVVTSSFASMLLFIRLLFSIPGTKICNHVIETRIDDFCISTGSYAHCFKCNACIFKKDHHCIWLNSCIGQNNKKTFIFFLISAVILGTSLFTPFYKLVLGIEIFPLFILLGFFCIFYTLVLLLLFSLSVYHIVLTCIGITSCEFYGMYFKK